ncbi:MAG TPA: hypothetical protein VGS02_06735 [Acidobacteriaceae bacterium]|nr:hypothetical protein [Acidobacteriaceae bacterium]
MASANSRPFIAAATAVFACAATAALAFCGNGLEPRWPLMWIAPLPVLAFALRSRALPAAAIAFIAWFTGYMNLSHYLRLVGVPPAAWLSGVAIAALVFALAILLFRGLILRGRPILAIFAFPAAEVAYEYLRNLSWPHGTSLSLAYSQLHFLPFLQTASLFGPWGMTFLLLLFPATIATAWQLRSAAPRRATRVAVAGLLPVAAALLFGAIRLALPGPSHAVQVALITSDAGSNDIPAAAEAPAQRLLSAYAGQASRLADAGARAIVIPEKVAYLTPETAPAADALFQPIADRSGATLVLGVDFEAPSVAWNQSRVYRPHQPVLTYAKHHLLPPFEDKFRPGTWRITWPASTGTWGTAICKDMDFTPLSRHYGEDGAGLMLVPAWDFNIDRAFHGHIAIMRAVEDGFSLVRSAKNGYATVTDNRGRILAERRSDAAPWVTISAIVPAAHSPTLFLLIGDAFAWFAMALLVLAVILSFRSSAEASRAGYVVSPDRSHALQ